MKVNNKISIFNIKQILAMKAEKHLYEKAKKSPKKKELFVEVDNNKSYFEFIFSHNVYMFWHYLI